MKYPITKKSIMSKVALLTLIAVTSSYAHGTVAETILSSFSKSFYIMEKKLSSFFNSSDKTGYKVYVETINEDFLECERILDTITRSPHDSLASLAYEIADYGRQMFSAVFGVIRKYMGKPATLEQAKNFQIDLERVFDPETAFKKIISKLEILKKKALSEGHNELVVQITTITKMIEAKRKEWNGKQKYALLAGLTTRMSC
jgi:hypothetical protein